MRAGQTTGDVKSKQWLVGPYHDPQYFSALFMSQFVPLAGLGTELMVNCKKQAWL